MPDDVPEEIEVGQLGEVRLGHQRLHDPCPGHRMGSHLDRLDRGQRTRLEQDAVRDTDLADVVQWREQEEELQELVVEADRRRQPGGDQPHVARDPGEVSARFPVPGLAQVRGHADGAAQELHLQQGGPDQQRDRRHEEPEPGADLRGEVSDLT